MATAEIFLALTMYAYIVSCINNYYSLIIPDEDFRIIRYCFDFTRMQFYKHSEISKMYIYVYKTNQVNITKIVLFISICKRTNVFYFTHASSPHLTFMLMCVHPPIVKYTLEFRPVFFPLKVTATRPVRLGPHLLVLHLLLIVILLVTPISLVHQLLVPMSQDTEELPISRYSRVDYFFGDDPFVDLDNQFAVVLATESVVEDSHDVSEGSLSPVIGDIHSTRCSGGLFCWRLTYHMILLWIWVSGLMMYLMLA